MGGCVGLHNPLNNELIKPAGFLHHVKPPNKSPPFRRAGLSSLCERREPARFGALRLGLPQAKAGVFSKLFPGARQLSCLQKTPFPILGGGLSAGVAKATKKSGLCGDGADWLSFGVRPAKSRHGSAPAKKELSSAPAQRNPVEVPWPAVEADA